MSIKCGNCKNYHDSIQAVRDCHTGGTVAVATEPVLNKEAYNALATLSKLGEKIVAKEAAKPKRLPASHYVVTIDGLDKFYRVTWGKKGGKWEGYTFLEVQASDDHWPVKNKAQKEAVFSAIREQGVLDCIARYGHALGKCGICGKTLTDPDSIAKGIGPICLAGL